jgi:hypothetical protein
LRKFLVVGAALAVVAVPATMAFGGSGRDRATGGGQILVGKGAGDTIAFTGQQIAPGSTAAKGEVQYIDRTGGTGKGHINFHGDVFCMQAVGNMAEIAYRPKGQPNGDIDQLYIVDNGEPNQGQDVVFIDEDPESQCAIQNNDNDDGDTALARGNAQVYDGG